jgi:hypothetical protein
MQLAKKILLSVSTVLSFGFLTTSCNTKNACDTLVCQNGGTCASDFCNCMVGYDGPQCENFIADRYIGTFAGMTDRMDGQPHHLDTVDVVLKEKPLTMLVTRRRGGSFTGTLDAKNNNIIIEDIKMNDTTQVVNVSIQSPSVTSNDKIINLNIVTYKNNEKINNLSFTGTKIK